ncbi:cyclic nucleotide-binding domain-containing protein [Oleisolibacter albus]|uniref:cyclic nucleotide-binding domain-containing protein n=1 Tax=Oleisolibacter albus TaxID=2171757 RepID=UPI0019614D5D|nr:cyclic nucleotide-binding domain-containing protein [Oleisolibacter albus]
MPVTLAADLEALRSVPLFASMDMSMLKLLAFTSERVEFAADSPLFLEKDQSDCAYVILSGSVEVMIDQPRGPVSITTLGRNSIVGEVGILCDRSRGVTAYARGPVVALRIGKNQFMRLVTEFPQVAIGIMRVLAERLDTLAHQLAHQLADAR